MAQDIDGPYGQQARALLDRHAAAIEGLLDHCERGAVLVTDNPDTMVLTHGEPTASNTMLTPSDFALVDWESALLAPAERAGYIDLFREPHEDTTDAAESWKNLLHFLQPDIRWPDLVD